MNPFDVISTRLYAQGTGVKERYTGPLDCGLKTVRAEGIRGVREGVLSRMVPQGTVQSVMWYFFTRHFPL